MVLLVVPQGLADGGFFPPVYYKEDLFEPSQKAVLIHDSVTEQLILQVSYKGNMTDFAWIVPTPGYPEVNKSSSLLFEELHYLTEPDYVQAPDLRWGYALSGLKESNGVQVYEQMQVGIFEVTILSADDSDALIDWLNDNQYSISSRASEVLQEYVDEGWFFTAMRINLEPSDEKLFESLRKINPRINSSEQAVELLTVHLMKAVKTESLYSEVDGISTVLDYGEVDGEPSFGNYYGGVYYAEKMMVPPYYRSGRPERIIDEWQYTQIYERYNGFLPEHMTSEVKNSVFWRLRTRIQVPDTWLCDSGQNALNSEYCDIWYFTKKDEAYKLLKDAECGPYCSLISKSKVKYSKSDLAKVGAYAALNGDESIIDYFDLSMERPAWYYNSEDLFNFVEGQVEGRLYNVLYERKAEAERELEQKLVSEFESRIETEFASLEDLSSYLSEKTIGDFENGESYMQSYIYGLDVLDEGEFNRLHSLYSGSRNDLELSESLKPIVENVVYWNQKNTQRRIGQGTIQPVSLTFKSKELIYPLKISSVNKGSSEILLYVFAKHKTKIDGFDVEYAKWIEPEDIENYKNLRELLDDHYFLTKFRRTMWAKEMTEDLVIEKAASNLPVVHKVYEPDYWSSWALMLAGIFLSYFIGLFVNTIPAFLASLLSFIARKPKIGVSISRLFLYSLCMPAFALGILILAHITKTDAIVFIAQLPFEIAYGLLHMLSIPAWISIPIVFTLISWTFFTAIHLTWTAIRRHSKVEREREREKKLKIKQKLKLRNHSHNLLSLLRILGNKFYFVSD